MKLPDYLHPEAIHAELLPFVDKESKLDAYELHKDFVFRLAGRKVVMPKKTTTDFGSVPRWAHWFARPTELALRPAYLKHDASYMVCGGLRQFVGRPDATENLVMNPVPRSRVDIELKFDVLACLLNQYQGKRYVLHRLWSRIRAEIIYLVVRQFGEKAWVSLDAGTTL